MNKSPYILALTIILLALGIPGKAQFGGSDDERSDGFGAEDPNDTSATQAVDSEDRLPTRVIAWHYDRATLQRDSTTIDTALDYHFLYSPVLKETFSDEHLGLPGEPYQSHLFMDRPVHTDFLFMKNYGAYSITPENTVFHNTTTPLTQIQFTSLFENEDNEQTFRILHTQNVNPYLNVGLRFKRQETRGVYQGQDIGNDAIALNANMQRKKYKLHAVSHINRFKVYHNGGLSSMGVIDSVDLYQEKTYPVNLNSTHSIIYNYGFNVHQMYLFGEREKQWVDSLRPDSLLHTIDPFLKPRSGLFHSFDYQSYKYLYHEAPMQYSYYRNWFNDSSGYVPTWDPDTTRDSVVIRYLRTRAGLHLSRNSGFPVDLTLSGGAERMQARFNLYQMRYREFTDTSYWEPKLPRDSIMYSYDVSAALGLIKTKNITLGGDGRYYVAGYLGGDYHAQAVAEYRYAHDSARKDLSRISARLYVSSKRAPFSMETHYTNYYSWHYDFDPEKRQSLNLKYNRQKWQFTGGVYAANLKSYLYFDHEAKPTQAQKSFSVFCAYADKSFRLGIFRFGNKLAVQTTNDEYLRLPLFTFRHATWADLFLFGNHLRLQPGIAVHFFSSYKADAFYPMTNQYYLQDEVEIGSYPNIQAFVNFRVAEARIFVSATNLGTFFLDRDYFYAPYYPIYPFMLKWGLSWMFLD